MAAGSNVGATTYAIVLDDTATKMAKAVREIADSPEFDKDQCRSEKLTLSQAYCLLWQNPESGDVDGRQSCAESNGGAAASVIIDLLVLDKVEVIIEPHSALGVKYDNILLKVIDDKPTGTYLDDALFNKILEHHHKHPDNPDKVKDWIYHDISHLQARHFCSTITLDSLVELGVLDKKEKFFGYKYPTLKPGIEDQLVSQIRAVALDNASPSGYIFALLTLARHSDNLMCLRDPILEKHFTKEEYKKVKEKINHLVGLGKKGNEKKYEKL